MIWYPSTSRHFTVKSTCNMLIDSRIQLVYNNGVEHIWDLVGKANLHGRHALFLWKWINGAIPTLERLKIIVHTGDNLCYLCGEKEESVHHLALECRLTVSIWWNS